MGFFDKIKSFFGGCCSSDNVDYAGEFNMNENATIKEDIPNSSSIEEWNSRNLMQDQKYTIKQIDNFSDSSFVDRLMQDKSDVIGPQSKPINIPCKKDDIRQSVSSISDTSNSASNISFNSFNLSHDASVRSIPSVSDISSDSCILNNSDTLSNTSMNICFRNINYTRGDQDSRELSSNFSVSSMYDGSYDDQDIEKGGSLDYKKPINLEVINANNVRHSSSDMNF